MRYLNFDRLRQNVRKSPEKGRNQNSDFQPMTQTLFAHRKI